MRRSVFIALLVLAPASNVWAQDVSEVELRIERLRSQLRDVVDREAQLQDRVARLDEDLKPENIERSVAAVGTTDAAALRARRRELLDKEKAEVAGQLSEVTSKRAGLEAEIATAEAEAVRVKAASLAPKEAPTRNAPAAAPVTPTTAPVVKRKAPAKKSKPRRRMRPRRRA